MGWVTRRNWFLQVNTSNKRWLTIKYNFTFRALKQKKHMVSEAKWKPNFFPWQNWNRIIRSCVTTNRRNSQWQETKIRRIRWASSWAWCDTIMTEQRWLKIKYKSTWFHITLALSGLEEPFFISSCAVVSLFCSGGK